jgi:hypothetical protein
MLPVVLVLLGILAALPFRRGSEPEPIGSQQSDDGDVPSTVIPLRVAGDDLQPSGDALTMLDQIKSSYPQPSQPTPPSFEMLPSSYAQVAVPLAGRDDAGNLLHGPRAGNAVPPASNVDGNRQSAWAFDRFGIPRPIENRLPEGIAMRQTESATQMTATQMTASPMAAADGWNPPQPLTPLPAGNLRHSVARPAIAASPENDRSSREYAALADTKSLGDLPTTRAPAAGRFAPDSSVLNENPPENAERIASGSNGGAAANQNPPTDSAAANAAGRQRSERDATRIAVEREPQPASPAAPTGRFTAVRSSAAQTEVQRPETSSNETSVPEPRKRYWIHEPS